MIAAVRVTEPGGESATHPRRDVQTLLTRVCRPNSSLHLT